MGGNRPGSVGLLAELVAFPLRDPSMEAGFVTRTLFACRAPFVWVKWRFEGLSGAATPLYESRWALLEEAAKSASLEGLHLEFGVFKGESINFLAQKVPCQWYGFDSFEGLPRKWTPGYGRGSFDVGGIAPTVRDNVQLVRGWFSETLPRFLDSVSTAQISFLHVDSDLYQSAQSIFTNLDALISAGTVIVFDEYAGLTPDDEARAFREWRRRARARIQFIGCARHGSVAVRILEREPSPARTATRELGALDREQGKREAARAAESAFERDHSLVVDCDYQNTADLEGLTKRVGNLVPAENLILLRLTVRTELAVRRKLADWTGHAGEPESYRESEVRRCHRDFTPAPLPGEVTIPTDGRSQEEVLKDALSVIRERIRKTQRVP